MPLTTNGVWYPDGGDSASIQTLMATQASNLDTLFGKHNVSSYRWANQSERVAQTGMRAGDLGYQEDTLETYQYNGSSWSLWFSPPKSFDPDLANYTPGNSTVEASYLVHFGLVFGYVSYLGGSGASFSGGTNLAAPVPISSVIPTWGALGTIQIFDSSNNYIGSVARSSAANQRIALMYMQQGSTYNAANVGRVLSFGSGGPGSWNPANGNNRFAATFSYRAA